MEDCYNYRHLQYWPRNRMLGANAVLEYYIKLITDVAPEDEPLTIEDAESHSRIYLGSPADPAEEAYVTSLFPAARKAIEAILGKPIGEQEYELGLSSFPFGWIIEFPLPPLIDILSIKYTKADGTVVALYDQVGSPEVSSDIFTVENGCEPGAMFVQSSNTWPSDILARGFPVKIRFTAGLTTVPANVLQAMRMVMGHLYENREITTDKTIVEVPMAAQWLCSGDVYDEFR